MVGGEREEQRIVEQGVQDKVLVQVERFSRLGVDQGDLHAAGAQGLHHGREFALHERDLDALADQLPQGLREQERASGGEGGGAECLGALFDQGADLLFDEGHPAEYGFGGEVVRDGRLAVVQRPGGAREGALVGDGPQDLELAELQQADHHTFCDSSPT